MELFTATAVFSATAASRGFDALPPITIENGFDLTTDQGQAEAWCFYRAQKPDVLAVGPPCD
eukprot:13937910-Alexandrium_andersonii.AAC.1